MSRKLTFNIFFLLITISSEVIAGANFKAKSTLPVVSVSGFYKILLTPDILGASLNNYEDIRLKNEKGYEIPFILTSEAAETDKSLFKEYKIVSKNNLNKITEVVIENYSGKKLNNIGLWINNSDAEKQAALSGSDDGSNWYVIKEKYWLSQIASSINTYEIRMLDFPLSSYKYLKLQINDSLSPPLNIIKAGYFEYFKEQGNFTALPKPEISISEEPTLKISIVKLSFDYLYPIDMIKFKISKPGLYLRRAEIADTIIYPSKNNPLYFDSFQSFTLQSGKENSISLPGKRRKEFYVIIYNQDNQPLEFEEISIYSLNKYMIASLDNNERYDIFTGNLGVAAPQYDLQYFKDSIPIDLSLLIPVQIERIALNTPAQEEEISVFKNPFIIWISLGVAAVILGIMTFQMLKSLKNNK